MDHRELAAYWNRVVRRWARGQMELPPRLKRWQMADDGKGAGAVDPRALPEPWIGNLKNRTPVILLALNPGESIPRWQHPGGIFAKEITEQYGCYSHWAASYPFLREPWTSKRGRNQFWSSRQAFLQRWLQREVRPDQVIGFELFPWHSKRVTTRICPDPGIIREFVVEPIESLGVSTVFAFGRPWFDLFKNQLGLHVVECLGAGARDYGSRVKGRLVLVCKGERNTMWIAEAHPGSAGPPSKTELELLRPELGRLQSA